MFKRTRIFETNMENSKYLAEFLNEYEIKHTVQILQGRIRYVSKMASRQFDAFATYLCDLGKMGVYPILL